MKHANEGTATPKNAGIEMVQLPNGKEAPLLVADLMSDIQMAIISQNVLAKLIALLPMASLSGIVQEFADKVQQFDYKARQGKVTIEDFADLLREELEFHTSVNLIQEYIGSTAKPELPTVYEEKRPEPVYPKP